MPIFSDEQIESMRATTESTFEDSCTRRRYAAGAADSYGNPTTGAATDVTLACHLVPAPGNEETTDRDVQTHEAAFRVTHDADVKGDDIIIHNGITWQVIGPAVTQPWPLSLLVLVRRTEAL